MSLASKLQQLVADFAVLEDPQERLESIVDRAKKIPRLPADDRSEANRVRGCVSVVWLVGERRDARCFFRSDADSPVVRGLVALLCEFFSDATAQEIAASNADPLTALGVVNHLSPTRRNGLAAALAAIRAFARCSVAAKPD